MVIDANRLVYVLSNDPRGDRVLEQLATWLEQQVDLNAPQLATYEVANGLTRLVAGGILSGEAAKNASRDLSLFPIRYHPIRDVARVPEIAFNLGRKTAYDAAYIALAEELGTELWTSDGPLYRNAGPRGFPVRLLA